jgi:CheY-like chemotaxis protein
MGRKRFSWSLKTAAEAFIFMTQRILIIDDEDDIRQVAAMSLETVAGWDVLLASSGRQGIERASAEQPDAILLDVMMPEMDGPTTLLKLKANGSTSHIPVLLLTAKVQGPDQRKFAEMGVRAILLKPFDPLTLAHQISTALGWQEGG